MRSRGAKCRAPPPQTAHSFPRSMEIACHAGKTDRRTRRFEKNFDHTRFRWTASATFYPASRTFALHVYSILNRSLWQFLALGTLQLLPPQPLLKTSGVRSFITLLRRVDTISSELESSTPAPETRDATLCAQVRARVCEQSELHQIPARQRLSRRASFFMWYLCENCRKTSQSYRRRRGERAVPRCSAGSAPTIYPKRLDGASYMGLSRKITCHQPVSRFAIGCDVPCPS